jgi:hypothetical protein
MSLPLVDSLALRAYLREEYPKWAGVCKASLPTLESCLMSLTDYAEYFYDHHLRHCPEPYKFHIQDGSYIADELSWREVIGIEITETQYKLNTINKVATGFKVMTKWDWRSLDENEGWGQNDKYFVINTNELVYGDTDDEFDSEHLEEWVDYLHQKSLAHIPPCEDCGTQEHNGLRQYCKGDESQAVSHYCEDCYSKKMKPPKRVIIKRVIKKKVSVPKSPMKSDDWDAMVEAHHQYLFDIKRGK